MIWHHAPADLAPEGGGRTSAGPRAAGTWPDSGTAVAPAGLPLTDEETAQKGLHDALVAFRRAYPAGVYSAKRMISPLLDVWALAAAVDCMVARPIEAELVTLAHREIVTSEELAVCIDHVERALAPSTPCLPMAKC